MNPLFWAAASSVAGWLLVRFLDELLGLDELLAQLAATIRQLTGIRRLAGGTA